MAQEEKQQAVPDTLKMMCPDCGTKLRSAALYQVATTVVRRKCSCGSKWQIRLVPLKSGDGVWIHELTWTRLAVLKAAH